MVETSKQLAYAYNNTAYSLPPFVCLMVLAIRLGHLLYIALLTNINSFSDISNYWDSHECCDEGQN